MSRQNACRAAAVTLVAVFSTGCIPMYIGEETEREPMPTSEASYTEMVVMPDGVRLATTVYLPQDGDGPWPTLLVRTPYGRIHNDEFVEFGEDMAEIGIVLVFQDQRGRYDSEGEDVSFFADKVDGPATIEWIVSQPWSNGRVATEGGSAMGIVQYLMAPGASDALTCQWIEVATPDMYAEGVYQGGVYRSEMVTGWLNEVGSSHLIEPWHANALNSDYWDAVQIVNDYANAHIPAFHVGGYFDAFSRGIIDGFLGYQNQGGAGAAGRQHLIMGPWVHAINEPSVGEMTYKAAILDELYDEWQPLWIEACLYESIDAAELDLLPTVTYYTMGAVGERNSPGNKWNTAETWPPGGDEGVSIYLHPGNTLDTEPPGRDGGGDTFAFDPANPSPTICGRTLQVESGSCDQRPIEERDDVIVYTSPVLDEPIEVTGDLSAQMWITTDVPDTDIVVHLTDVYPDGRSMLVVDSIIRTRYHSCPDFDCEEFLEPGQPYLLALDLGPTSIVFNTGHQIRVSVTSSNWPRFSVNPNTGEDFLREGESGQVAHTTILHDSEHPSAVILPIK
jgi:predicted acyl esterase